MDWDAGMMECCGKSDGVMERYGESDGVLWGAGWEGGVMGVSWDAEVTHCTEFMSLLVKLGSENSWG